MKEYVIWGKQKSNSGPFAEELLVSEKAGIKDMAHAKKTIEILETMHDCYDCRVQVLDLSQPLEWDARSMINA